MLKISNRELRQLLTQSAETGYNYDMRSLPHVQAVPFHRNEAMQQIVAAAVALAQDDLSNITQTLGMVDPFGRVQPLQEAYRQCMDYAFMQVATGATDYNTAIRNAVKNLADKGVVWIDYESGVHTSLEAAVRRNVMGGRSTRTTAAPRTMSRYRASNTAMRHISGSTTAYSAV